MNGGFFAMKVFVRFCLDAKRTKKIKAAAIAPRAQPGRRTRVAFEWACISGNGSFACYAGGLEALYSAWQAFRLLVAVARAE